MENNKEQEAKHTQPQSLEDVIGVANMEKAMSSALGIWNKFLEKYPEKMLTKSFLANNLKLVRRILESVVPDVMKKTIELEDHLGELIQAYDISHKKHLQEIIALASVIPVTASMIETVEQLDDVADKLLDYGILVHSTDDLKYQPKDGGDPVPLSNQEFEAENLKLVNPMWLICAIMPNDTLSPHLIDHNQYCSFGSKSSSIKTVDLAECALMHEAEEVTDLLRELDM